MRTIIETKDKFIIKPRVLVNTVLLWVYTFNAVFIPYDNFGLKKISFALLIVINGDIIINGFCALKKDSYAIILMGAVLPVYTIIKSILLTGNIIDNVLSGYTGMILLLFFVIKHSNIKFADIYVKVCVLLAAFIIFCVLLDFLGIQSVFKNPILAWMYSTSNANIGKSGIYLLGYYIFIKTTPMLIIVLGLLLSKKKYLLAVVVAVALVLSGTRANAVLAIATFGAGFILTENSTLKRSLAVIVVVVLAGYVLFGQGLLEKFLSFSSQKTGSDAIRQATLPSIIKTWKENPVSFFIGQGYSSEFYNAGRQSWSSDCELAYWNLLRRIGLFCFVSMMYCYFNPIRAIIKKRKNYAIAIAYLAYLAGAYVNPLLYTSTGLTVLLCVYAYAFTKEDG